MTCSSWFHRYNSTAPLNSTKKWHASHVPSNNLPGPDSGYIAVSIYTVGVSVRASEAGDTAIPVNFNTMHLPRGGLRTCYCRAKLSSIVPDWRRRRRDKSPGSTDGQLVETCMRAKFIFMFLCVQCWHSIWLSNKKPICCRFVYRRIYFRLDNNPLFFLIPMSLRLNVASILQWHELDMCEDITIRNGMPCLDVKLLWDICCIDSPRYKWLEWVA